MACSYCGSEVRKIAHHVNVATRKGRKMYCDHKCYARGRSKKLSEKKAVKAEYDANVRLRSEFRDRKRMLRLRVKYGDFADAADLRLKLSKLLADSDGRYNNRRRKDV